MATQNGGGSMGELVGGKQIGGSLYSQTPLPRPPGADPMDQIRSYYGLIDESELKDHPYAQWLRTLPSRPQGFRGANEQELAASRSALIQSMQNPMTTTYGAQGRAMSEGLLQQAAAARSNPTLAMQGMANAAPQIGNQLAGLAGRESVADIQNRAAAAGGLLGADMRYDLGMGGLQSQWDIMGLQGQEGLLNMADRERLYQDRANLMRAQAMQEAYAEAEDIRRKRKEASDRFLGSVLDTVGKGAGIMIGMSSGAKGSNSMNYPKD